MGQLPEIVKKVKREKEKSTDPKDDQHPRWRLCVRSLSVNSIPPTEPQFGHLGKLAKHDEILGPSLLPQHVNCFMRSRLTYRQKSFNDDDDH